LRKALFEQRTSLLLLGRLGLIALGSLYFLGVSTLRCKSARELRARQLNPAMPAQQMELDFGNPP
jgi:hypothetical protein